MVAPLLMDVMLDQVWVEERSPRRESLSNSCPGLRLCGRTDSTGQALLGTGVQDESLAFMSELRPLTESNNRVGSEEN